MDDETRQAFTDLNKTLMDKFNKIDSRLNGMQGSIDGLRTLLNSTCDRVTILENHK